MAAAPATVTEAALQGSAAPVGWAAVDGGGTHTCGLLTNGTLLCWGGCDAGQCDVPRGVAAWAAVSTGDGSTTCALSRDARQLHCFGDNSFNQTTVPAAARGARWSLFTAGRYHTCGVTEAAPARMRCWGRGLEGQLDVPALPAARGATRWAAVSAGAHFTCATTDAGDLACWGCNVTSCFKFGHGQTHPPELPAGRAWRPGSIASGGFSACAIHDAAANDTTPAWSRSGGGATSPAGGGTLVCWGSDVNSQSTVPGGFGEGAWTLAAPARYGACGLLDGAGRWGSRIACWGIRGLCLEDGGGGHCPHDPAATVVPHEAALLPWAVVGAGAWHACAISARDATAMRCWGSNLEGQGDVPQL